MKIKPGEIALAIGFKETVNFIKEKTGLNEQMIHLVLEIFSFVIKKTLFEHGKLHFFTLGTFFVKFFKHKNRVKNKYNICFCSSDDFKEMIKLERSPFFCLKQAFVLRTKFRQVSDMLGIKKSDIRYLFALYSYCIIVNLLKYNEYKMHKFGYLRIIDRETLKKTGISKNYQGNVNTKIVSFKLTSTSFDEVNRFKSSIEVSERLKRMLYFAKIDRTIKKIPYFDTIKREVRHD